MNINQLIKAFGSYGDGALTLIDYAHAQVHKGYMFTAFQRTAADGLDIASPLTFWFVPIVGTVPPHILIKANIGAQGYLEVFEDDGDSDHFNVSGADAFVPINRNRVSDRVSNVNLFTGVTVTQATDDCLIYAETLGNLIGGEHKHEHEFIFQAGVEYLIRLSTFADNNEGSLVLNWYERDMKTY